MSSRNEVAERNEAAERLARFLGMERREELTDLALHNLLDEALAAERRATVKRIFEAAHRNSHFDGGAFAALRAILDEEAEGQGKAAR